MRADPVVFAGLMPHAPILIPGVGKDHLAQVKRTVWAMAKVAMHAVAAHPQTLLVISPHSPRRAGAFGIWQTPRLRGSMDQFGSSDDNIDLPLDRVFANALEQEAATRGVRTWRIPGQSLDHGAFVPLSYLVSAGWSGPTVVVSPPDAEDASLDEFGQTIAATAQALGKCVAVIASGDMSHRLSPDAPGGYDPAGSQFDHAFIAVLRRGTPGEIRQIDPALQDAAGEDAVASTRIALASAGYSSSGHDVLSYERPFGVGYGVAILFEPTGAGAKPAPPITENQRAMLSCGAELPMVARCAVAARFKQGPVTPLFQAAGELADRHGLFVTVRTDRGELRGCHGSALPTTDLVRATWDHAVAAAFHDPRFTPVTADEVPRLRFTVSILGQLEPVASLEDLNPEEYGIIIAAAHGRRALLLPAIPGIDTVAKQLSAARDKAGIGPHEHIEIHRFRTRRFEETTPPRQSG